MNQIQNITDDPFQSQTIILPDGSSLYMELSFRQNQISWFFNTLKWNTTPGFEVHGLRVTCNPNILRQWKNKLNFGMACFSADNREPNQKEDFATGASGLYILTAAEVLAYEDYLATP
jgi:hypothetical protein